VRHVEPATPNDREDSKKDAKLNLEYESQRLSNALLYSFSDLRETFQDLVNLEHRVSNIMQAEVFTGGLIQMSTNYINSQIDVGTISSQLNKTFMHSTGLGYTSYGGFAAQFDHSFTRTDTKTKKVEGTADLHTLGNGLTIPISSLQYTFMIKNPT
jgi:hypothetical protein